MSQPLEYKIILIGNSGVGKTSLYRKLSTGEFCEANISTIGVEKRTIYINFTDDKNDKKKINVSLFDTAGQEKFRSITLSYFKGTDGILLMYDITNRSTFENVEMWINSINEAIGTGNDSKFQIILIGNKTDLIDQNGYKREVEEDEAKDISAKYNMLWGGEQSTKNIEVDELNKLFESYVKSIYKKVGDKPNEKQNIKKIGKYKNKNKRDCCSAIL